MISRYIGFYESQEVLIGIVLLALAIILGVSVTELSTTQICVIALGVVGVILCFFVPRLPLFVFFLFIPLELITVLPSQSLTKFIGLYLLGLAFIELAITKRIYLPKGGKKQWILIFGLISLISLLVASDKSTSLIYLISLFSLIGMYFILSFVIRDIKTLHIAILSLLAGTSLSIIIGFLGWGWIRQAYMTGGSFTRIGGLWGDPNSLAANLLVLMPLSLLYFFRSKSIYIKFLTLCLFALFLMAFLHTFSRGGFLGLSVLLILGMFKLDLLRRSSNKVKIIAGTMLIALVLGAVFLTVSETFIDRMKSLTTPFESESDTESAISARFEAYREALNSILDRPILGIGFRNFHTISTKGVVHNTYLEVLACTGILGFIPFMTILFLSWKELRKVQNFWKVTVGRSSLYYQLAVALELGFIAYLVSATFVSMEGAKMTWLLIILPSILYSNSVRTEFVKTKK